MVPGQKLGVPPKPYTPPAVPEGVMNKTDPDSRMMRTQGQPTVQGYNAQAAVTRGQIIVAAEIAVESPDFGHLEPAVRAALREPRGCGCDTTPRDRPGLCGLLAHPTDGEHRQRRHPSAGPARCRATQGRQTGMGGRSLRIHAPSARNRGWTRALQAPQSDRRAAANRAAGSDSGRRPSCASPITGDDPRCASGQAAPDAEPPYRRLRAAVRFRGVALGRLRSRLLSWEGTACRRQDALVAVVPLDSVSRRGVPPHDFFDDATARLAAR